MARDFDPFGSNALERALAGQRAFEDAMESQRRIQAFLQPPTLAAIHERQQLMDAVWERQHLFERAWEAQQVVERAWDQQRQVERAWEQAHQVERAWERAHQVERAVQSSLEVQRRIEENRQSLESALVERNRLMTELDAATETQRRIAEFTALPGELISSARLAEEAYTQALRLQDIAVQFVTHREYIDRLIATAVPSLPDVSAAEVAARLTESLSARLAAEVEAEPEPQVYGSVAILRLALLYKRAIESLPAEWKTPEMQAALANLQVTLFALLLSLALNIISLTCYGGPTQAQFQEFSDGVLAEERRQTALTDGVLAEEKHQAALAQRDSAIADSTLAEERKQTQLLEAILEQGEPPSTADSTKATTQ
jgi:hypothetical protein